MLVTDVGDEMCWCQLYDVVDGFGHFGHRNSKDITKIEILSPTSKNYRQLEVTSITTTIVIDYLLSSNQS